MVVKNSEENRNTDLFLEPVEVINDNTDKQI